MSIRIRRTTRYVPPASQAAAGQLAPSSPGCTQTCCSTSAVSSALTLAVPSLNPNRLRGVGLGGRRRRGAPEAELRPADARGAERGPGQVADRVHRDLRVVGAGLDDEVAVGARRVEVVGREVRQLDEARRAAGPRGRTGRRARPAGPTNSERPKPNVIVRPAGGRSIASPVSSGGASYGPPVGPYGPADRPAVSRAAIVVQRRSRSTSSSRDVVVRSNAAMYSRSCAGVTMPAWCTPVNGYVRCPARRRRRGVRRSARRRRAPPTAARPPSPIAAAPPAATPRKARRETRRLAASASGADRASGLGGGIAHPAPVTVVVSCDSGSLSASTAAASALTSAGASLS